MGYSLGASGAICTILGKRYVWKCNKKSCIICIYRQSYISWLGWEDWQETQPQKKQARKKSWKNIKFFRGVLALNCKSPRWLTKLGLRYFKLLNKEKKKFKSEKKIAAEKNPGGLGFFLKKNLVFAFPSVKDPKRC